VGLKINIEAESPEEETPTGIECLPADPGREIDRPAGALELERRFLRSK
jgi:hypothetical protein